ncbi:NAD(P)-binding protein [Ophiobolus disseminans]|uniref:NAD(P)-binding protein n=1 Tax=Ophiobolus disseminans TaxID=1469910 RepID=A0A6A6ZJG6_9PLEO|nr:NAD(P)-binding protein [Ophiobolus disseminans]
MAPLNVYVSFYTSLIKSLTTLVFARLYKPQKLSQRDLSGQTAIVTGANSGIGLSIAVQLAKQDATVYLACRNPQRGQKAVDEVVARVGEKSEGKVHCWDLDTSDLNSVRSFCERWITQGKKIDMLVHNAGIASAPPNSPTTTQDGKELIYVTNFLGSFLMTHLLERHLFSDARVVLTSSSGHYSAAETLFKSQTAKETRAPGLATRAWKALVENLGLEKSSAPAYGRTKAQQVLFAQLLQAHFSSAPQNGRTAHAFTPGFTATPIFSNLVDFMRGVMGEREFAKKAEGEWRRWEGDADVNWDVGL